MFATTHTVTAATLLTCTLLAGAIGLTTARASSFTPAPAPDAGSALIDEMLEAHGGIDLFRSKRQMIYTMHGFPLSPSMAKQNRSTVDLATRSNRIDGDGFTVGFDGMNAWSTPGPDAVGLPPRFVTLGSLYFIAMPFVFADEGAVHRDLGRQTFRGRTYDVVQVGYRPGIGHSSEDDYTVFIDPATRRLALIHHSVTENPDVDRVTWTFDAWQRIDGLLVPSKMTFYPGWNRDEPGDGASFSIDDVILSATPPAPELYRPPAEAVID